MDCRLRNERGTSLIEVIVAAAMLLVVAGAVTGLVDAATRDSAQTRVQAVAFDLAQSEMEELRSRRFNQLVGLDTTQAMTSGGIDFQIRKQTQWSAGGTGAGASGCSSNTRTARTMQVTTTVTWNQMKRDPVRITSLVAAPAASQPDQGVYTVQVADRDGYGVSNLAVTMSGTSSMTGQTDAAGCVRFTDLPAGPYTVTASRPGWMAPDGTPALTRDVTVVAGDTASISFVYDQGGTALARFVRADNASVTVPVYGATFASANMTRSAAPTPGPTAATLDSPALFPAAGQYSVTPDTCAGARPSSTGISVPRGGPSPRTDVKVPVVSAQVRSSVRSAGTIWLRAVSACGSRFEGASVPRDTGGPPSRTYALNVAVPGGTLQSVCAIQHDTGATPDRWYWTRTTNFNVNADAVSHPQIDVDNTPSVTSATDPALCAS